MAWLGEDDHPAVLHELDSAKTVAQSSFMLTTVQPFAAASHGKS